MKKRILTAIALAASMFIGTAQAALIDSTGNTFFTDSDTSLDWLDITSETTLGRTFNDVSSQLGSGGEFEGFRFATEAEFRFLTDNNGIYDLLSLFLNESVTNTTMGFFGVSSFLAPVGSTLPSGYFEHFYDGSFHNDLLGFAVDSGATPDSQFDDSGSFLVRDSISVSAVPVPAAVFMFLPALLGFLGLRRKMRV